MAQESILFPMFALVGWTFIVAGVMLGSAFKAVREGLNPRFFQYGTGAKPPGYMRAAYQHYSNMHEMPVLFYTAVLTAYAASMTDVLLVALSWVYVAARVVHSVIHLRNRSVARRRDSFLVSVAMLVSIWGVLIAKVISG